MSESAHEVHGDLERLKKQLLTVKDLADKLNLSEKTIYTQEGDEIAFSHFKTRAYAFPAVRVTKLLPSSVTPSSA